MIIGKGGNYIKQIKEESGSYIQLSQKADAAVTLQERCVTIIGKLNIPFILDKFSIIAPCFDLLEWISKHVGLALGW